MDPPIRFSNSRARCLARRFVRVLASPAAAMHDCCESSRPSAATTSSVELGSESLDRVRTPRSIRAMRRSSQARRTRSPRTAERSCCSVAAPCPRASHSEPSQGSNRIRRAGSVTDARCGRRCRARPVPETARPPETAVPALAADWRYRCPDNRDPGGSAHAVFVPDKDARTLDRFAIDFSQHSAERTASHPARSSLCFGSRSLTAR